MDKPGSRRASATTLTKREAEQAAKRILGNDGGGEVIFRDSQGRFTDSDTVKPGNDPNPPRDRRQ